MRRKEELDSKHVRRPRARVGGYVWVELEWSVDLGEVARLDSLLDHA